MIELPVTLAASRHWSRLTWRRILFAVALAVELLAIAPKLAQPRAYIGPDAFVFEYTGWLITQGGVPYLHVWDPKPPLIFEITAGLAWLTGGSPLHLHIVSVLVTSGLAVGSVLLVGELVYHITDNRLASLSAGLSLLTFPTYYLLPAHGIRPKYFTLSFGLFAVYVWLKGYRMAGGGLAAASAATWQLGVIFPAIVVGLTVQRYRGDLSRVLAAMATVTILVVTPVVVRGGGSAMLNQVVLAPLVVEDGGGIIMRLQKGRQVLGFAAPLSILGVWGAGSSLRDGQYRTLWWVPVGLSWFSFQLIQLDFDGPPDVLLWFAFVALGVGLLTGGADGVRNTQVVSVLVVGTLLLSLPWVVQLEFVNPTVVPPANEVVDAELFWGKQFPETCHIRGSRMEDQWLSESLKRTCAAKLRVRTVLYPG